MDQLPIALIQMASAADRKANLQLVDDLLAQCPQDCALALLPENVLCLGRGETIRQAARTEAELVAELGELCRRHSLAAVFGGVPLRHGSDIVNASLALSSAGSLLARYDKMHLFQLDPGRPGAVDETRIYQPGQAPVAVTLHGWKIGLGICYDIRFPELYRTYAPCDLLVCTAAFTRATGQAHWELLLRARAVENLAYMAGTGQCGTNQETGVEQFGESLAVDPWGEVVARLPGTTPGIVPVILERSRIDACRSRLPALRHCRFRCIPNDQTAARNT